MQIRLTQSGGLLGKKMESTVNSTITEIEWNLLIDTIAATRNDRSKRKDSFSYTLQKNDDADSKTLIDINAIPDKYNDLFEELFNGLKSL